MPKQQIDLTTVTYDLLDALVDTDPITLRDIAVAALQDLRANEGAEDARLAIAEATVEELTGPDARERLARRLFLDAHAGDRWAQNHWDFGGDQHVNREPWLARAGKYLAVIAGKES